MHLSKLTLPNGLEVPVILMKVAVTSQTGGRKYRIEFELTCPGADRAEADLIMDACRTPLDVLESVADTTTLILKEP